MYGDEFFVFAELAKESIVPKFEKLLVDNIQVRMEKKKYDFHLEASLGYALYKENSDIDDFIKACDYSMYKTKIRKKSLRSK
jgi:GGDEF domain-containing protein